MDRNKYIEEAERLYQDGEINEEKYNVIMDQIDDFCEPAVTYPKIAEEIVEFMMQTDPYSFEDNFEEGATKSDMIEEYLDYLLEQPSLNEVISNIESIIEVADNEPDIISYGYDIIADLKTLSENEMEFEQELE